MDSKDIKILLKQINSINNNIPLSKDFICENSELIELESEIFTLSKNIAQCTGFLDELSHGNLKSPLPDKHNFLASELKTLHANLLHLHWQAEQVEKGDYSQKVSFLGDFSDAFNRMIKQLDEREKKLSNQAKSLANSIDLLISIINNLPDTVVVVENISKQILYANLAANKHFNLCKRTKGVNVINTCELLNQLFTYNYENLQTFSEFTCCNSGNVLLIKSYPIQWKDKNAIVHFITNVTKEKVEKAQLQTFAYLDALTGLYNRRYCFHKISTLVEEKKEFCLCLVDLDGLKKVNDVYGHLSGDNYIIQIANILLGMQNDNTIASRFGGDEFILIFLKSKKAQVNEILKKIQLQLIKNELTFPVSISYGIISVSPIDNNTVEELLSKVDKKMYINKKAKR